MTSANDNSGGSPVSGGDDATEQAVRWLLALEDAPDDPDLDARFRAWLAADPANAAAWRDTLDVYCMMARTPPIHGDRWPRPAPRRAVRHLAATGVALALAACLAVAVLPRAMIHMEADHVTATAQDQDLTLADGSRVNLAPDSAVAVDFTAGERRVRLIKGQAFFTITPDAARPFRVAAGRITTTVLGTAFDVRLGDTGAAVSVHHGRVSVEDTAAHPPVSERLGAGDWGRVGWAGDFARGAAPPSEAGAWRDGRIVARDRRLDDVVDDLRRYFPGVIIVADSDLGAKRISGVYNLTDPAAALAAMAGAHGGTVRRLSPWVLLATSG